MYPIKNLIFIIVLFFATSCATFFNPFYPEVDISTAPKDTYVYIDGWILKTPAKIKINAKTQFLIAKKQGYKEKEVALEKKLRFKQVYLANIIWGPFYPWAIYVDYSSGKAYEIEKNININLERE